VTAAAVFKVFFIVLRAYRATDWDFWPGRLSLW